MFCLYGLHDCNSAHYQCGLASIVLRFCLHYSRLMMISFADATLAGELLSISVYTVYASESMLSTQAVDVDAVDLSLCLYTIQQQAYDSS